ncbi:hypothetical protein VE02_07748 [Pseudogymnoascus sp. 03VT05]|nr:hypothetical protein VE02_07748 [Pseudogymnoascus sp. 03VT05]
MPTDSQAPEPWFLDNHSSALNALYLRLAFIIEQVRYEAGKGNRDYREPQSWIVRHGSTKESRMSTLGVMWHWRPTSSLMGDLEEQACMLQDFSNVAFEITQVKLQSLEEMEARLVRCFNAFRGSSSLHEPIFTGLGRLSLTPGCSFNSSLEAIYRILTLSSTANILRVWKPIAKVVAKISIQAYSEREKLDVVKLFNHFKTREDSEKSKLRGKGEFVTDISDSKWARFYEFYRKFDTTQGALEGVAGREILYFLLNPSNRDESLEEMSKLLSASLDNVE